MMSKELPAELMDRIGTDLGDRRLQKTFCCIEGSQEHSGLHNSYMREVCNN